MEQYFMNYASLQQQRWMVADKARTDSFAQAITEVVKPGDVVVDVGAGTGLLSILAAKAGARRVIGVERSNMAHFARKLINFNGFSDRVEIFHGNAHDLRLDEGVDVVISEWLGHMAYVEGMFRSVIHVRDSCLKDSGRLIPSSVDLMLAPIEDNELYFDHGPGFWGKNDIHGIDFSCFIEDELEMGHTNQLLVPDKFLLAPGKPIHHLKTKVALPRDEWGEGVVDYTVQRDGMLNGFVGWFSTQLSENIILDTAPHCPQTHWRQTYFPFHPIELVAGQILQVAYQMDEPFDESRLMEMTIRVGAHKIKYVVD